jgi:hypothetical protein
VARYLLDSNVFIQARRVSYPFDVFPAFWDWLADEYQKGSIVSIKFVKDEIMPGGDELADWFKCQDSGWFLSVDDKETQRQLAEIANHVSGLQHIKHQGRQEFLSGADPWLIAKAKVNDMIVVTEEKSDPYCKKKPFIPDICMAFDVECCSRMDMMRALGARI